METIRLDRKSQDRAAVLIRLIERRLTIVEAAEALGLSVRQVERLRARFRREGPAALVHGNQGRRSHNYLCDDVRRRIEELARGTYRGFNHEHLREQLAAEEGIAVSADTVRRVCLDADVPAPRQRRRRTQRRARRERSEHVGDMLQMDGSPHDWLEGRGPRLTLLNAIDDASGRKWSQFFEGETLEAYMLVLRMVISACGVPAIVYVDGISSARGGASPFRPRRPEPDTTTAQLRRALTELGSRCIVAGSPQAKGRVERTHGTDQDRLVSLLRRHGAASLSEANRVLPTYLRDFNRRFTVPPRQSELGWLPRPRLHLDDVLCLKEERVVARDNSVRVYGQVIDIPAGSPRRDYAGLRVTVHRRFDGSSAIFLGDRRIAGDPAGARRPTESLRS